VHFTLMLQNQAECFYAPFVIVKNYCFGHTLHRVCAQL
jgi:hypothetical protein